MFRNLFVALLSLLPSALFAQSPLKVSFGQSGKLSYAPDQFNEVVDIVVTNGDSLFVLAYCGHPDTMYFNTDITITKMDALGNMDPSFGQGGTVRYDFDGMNYSTANELLLCNDGRILVLGSGYSFANLDYNPMCVMMLTPSGQPDSSFGINGTVKIEFYGSHEIAAAITTDINGNALIAGASIDTLDNSNVPVAARLSGYQYADSSFGGTGKLALSFATGLQSLKGNGLHISGGTAFDVLSLNDGSLLVGGSYAADCFVAKLLPDGTLDTSFSNDGYIFFQTEEQYNNMIDKMAALPDGTVLLFISTDKAYDRDYYIGRLDPASSSISGIEYVDYSSYEDILSDVALTPQGSIVAAGRCIKPANAQVPAYRSDYFSITVFHDPQQLSAQQKILIQYDPLYQSGASAVAVQLDGTIVCAGFTYTPLGGQSDIVLMAIDPGYYLDVIDLAGTDDVTDPFPNPAHSSIHLSHVCPGSPVILTNVLGKEVHTMVAYAEQIDISLESLAPGIYFIRSKDMASNTRVIRLTKE
jgi:uncharacterized delta-60 repeat protein